MAKRAIVVGDQVRAPVAHPPDSFEGVWEEEIEPPLQGEAAGRLRTTTIIEGLEEKFPSQFNASQLRTLQRRLQDW